MNYDTAGNMTSRAVSGGTSLTFTWTADNKPENITKNGSCVVSFTYDGNGQRVIKQYGANKALYFGEVYEKRNGREIFYLFANGHRIAQIRSDGNRYYHPNHLGSASVITDENGTETENIGYYP